MVNAFFVFCGCVDQASVAVVEKWGRFIRLAEPGLHFFNPFASECIAGTLTTRVQSLHVRVETKTKDNVFVHLICTIQYRVVKEHADDAFYELQNPQHLKFLLALYALTLSLSGHFFFPEISGSCPSSKNKP